MHGTGSCYSSLTRSGTRSCTRSCSTYWRALFPPQSVSQRVFPCHSLSLIYHLAPVQNLKDQILTTNVWLEHEWQDHKFKWDPSEYGGVTELYVPSEHIWLPDIVLYNK